MTSSAGALGRNDQVDTGSAGLLRDAADIVLDLLARDHHQVSQLVNDDGDIGQVLQAGLGGQLVVGLDLADVVLGKELVAALHLGHRWPPAHRQPCAAR